MSISCEIAHVKATEHIEDKKVNIISIESDQYRYMMSLGHNELKEL